MSPNSCLAGDCNYQLGEISTEDLNGRWENYINKEGFMPHSMRADEYKSSIVTTIANTCASTYTVPTYASVTQLNIQGQTSHSEINPETMAGFINVNLMTGINAGITETNMNSIQCMVPPLDDQPTNLQPIYGMLMSITKLITDGNKDMRNLQTDITNLNIKLDSYVDDVRQQGEAMNELALASNVNASEICNAET